MDLSIVFFRTLTLNATTRIPFTLLHPAFLQLSLLSGVMPPIPNLLQLYDSASSIDIFISLCPPLHSVPLLCNSLSFVAVSVFAGFCSSDV